VLDKDRLRRCRLARKREALRKALELKDYEFNAHGAELGQAMSRGPALPI
jgi:2,4-dichlorophenol 6-monooxygenase